MTRREREEAMLKDYQPHDIDILASALEAAHRREDHLRGMQRFWWDMDGGIEEYDDGQYVLWDSLIEILDADEVKQ